MRHLWRLWRDRRKIRGKYYIAEIKGAWWRRSNRRSARLAVAIADDKHDVISEATRRAVSDALIQGTYYVSKDPKDLWNDAFWNDAFGPPSDFVPDEWPYPDDPPDPL